MNIVTRPHEKVWLAIFRPKRIDQSGYQARRGQTLWYALLAAVLLHLMIAALIPGIPSMSVLTIDRDGRLIVTLLKQAEPDVFRQTLQTPNIESDDAVLADTAKSSILNLEHGWNDDVSDASVAQSGRSLEKAPKTSPVKQNSDSESIPNVVLSMNALRRFSIEQATQYADDNPEEVRRFSRTFNSRANTRRRNRAVSYINQYGDQYVRDTASSGDICFVKKSVGNTGASATNTVHFFRCDREELVLELDAG